VKEEASLLPQPVNVPQPPPELFEFPTGLGLATFSAMKKLVKMKSVAMKAKGSPV
jgi:hypothetical protein